MKVFKTAFKSFRILCLLLGLLLSSVQAQDAVNAIADLAEKGLLDSAYKLSQIQNERNPDDPLLSLLLAKLNPDGKASAELLKKIIAANANNPNTQESYFRLGQYYYAIGKYNLAIPYFRDYLRIFPQGYWKEPAAYWMGNACLFFNQSQKNKKAYLDTGEVYFHKLIDSLKPEAYYYALAWEGLAKIKMSQGKREEALSAWNKALANAPKDELSAILLLGIQLQTQSENAAAKKLNQRLMDEMPLSLEAQYLKNRVITNSIPNPPSPVMSASKNIDTIPESKSSFTLQLGAFAQKANAENLCATLAKKNLKALIMEGSREGKKIYFVQLGRYTSENEASEFAKTTLKSMGIVAQPLAIPE